MERALSFQPVEDWLRCLGLLHYAQSFYDNGYEDLETCKLIKEADLNVIGMKNDKDREDIMTAVDQLHQNIYFELKSNGADNTFKRSKMDTVELETKLKGCVKRDKKKLTVSFLLT